MKKKLNCVLLVDDDKDCNYFHELLLKRAGCTEHILTATSGSEALNLLILSLDGKCPRPDLILLDINMPNMDGWGFLEEYKKLSQEEKIRVVIVMLTTSLNPDDQERANKTNEVVEYYNKYMDKNSLHHILRKHFGDYF